MPFSVGTQLKSTTLLKTSDNKGERLATRPYLIYLYCYIIMFSPTDPFYLIIFKEFYTESYGFLYISTFKPKLSVRSPPSVQDDVDHFLHLVALVILGSLSDVAWKLRRKRKVVRQEKYRLFHCSEGCIKALKNELHLLQTNWILYLKPDRKVLG